MKLARFRRSHFRSRLRLIIASAWSLAYLLPLSALIASEPLAKGIQDNSFFIEEAYNQEPGVVQHIFNLAIDFTNGSREIAPSFTQEWPVFSQTHQFSYTIPYLFTEDDNGMEDMRLNYRLQAFMEGKYTPAFAPRLSLVLPTGDSDKGFGTGVVGYEFNLPFSKIVSDRWTLNFNAGMSVFPNAHQSRHLTNYNVGASAIYAVSRDFNHGSKRGRLELIATELKNTAGGTQHLIMTPAARSTPPSTCEHSRTQPLTDAQLVIGAAPHLSLRVSSPDWCGSRLQSRATGNNNIYIGQGSEGVAGESHTCFIQEIANSSIRPPTPLLCSSIW